MRLLRIPEPFDHPEWIFEPKMDGFRALAHVEGHSCTLVSRNGNTFKSWPQLAEEIAHSVRAHSVILDGEICCLEQNGTSNFKNLLFRREWPHFLAFDVIVVDGDDVRALPLLRRKRVLKRLMPKTESRLRYVDHIVVSVESICSAWHANATWRGSSGSGAGDLHGGGALHELCENQESRVFTHGGET
jgi:ATP-dependent DNA ligase